ncbi:sulfatase-modifying factor enzyme 1 [Lacibacter cauensis]|uniref:Sulfatase-modifying factor enzyme 1 n=1 Tax=Lacibacter cauensis TaxID=510947 RepID=A0A562SRT2_9BACT|nr:SUMF1/EgtB/PvdO family nonheme iron enzyme [Lacibacter cauensis]TWI83500.1 sulfatase-modifying factor enzyme 1 [Lacibacter cauensis]
MKMLIAIPLLLCSLSLVDLPDLRDPTMVKINDTLYAGISEVTLYQWKLFLFESQKGTSMSKAERKYFERDSLYWKSVSRRFGGIPSDYFLNPEYSWCPVVGVSYEEAVAFCDWVNLKVRSKFKNGYQYTYRLPSESEWEYIASCENKLGNNKKPLEIYNTADKVIRESVLSRKFQQKSYCCNDDFRLLSIYDSYKSSCGLIHIKGNVSEMVQEKNIAKGGSFKQTLLECDWSKRQSYLKPELWVGFRYVVIKKESK